MPRPQHGASDVSALVTRNYDPLWLRQAGSIRATIDDGELVHGLKELSFRASRRSYLAPSFGVLGELERECFELCGQGA